VLVLHGLNLEIADAANRSGFNTRHQVALMDLIWSVRRIAFRHAVARPKIQRPPYHPVYPDRYRPGDASDNTSKARKRGREPEEDATGAGTVEHPINVDDDDLEVSGVGTAANSSAKRLKVAAGRIGRHKVELPVRLKLLNPVHPTKFHNSSNNRQERGHNTQRTNIYTPSPRFMNLPPPRPSSVAPFINSPRPLLAKPPGRSVIEMRKVGNILKDNIDAVMECCNMMKAMYSRDNRLGVDDVYKELEHLKESFDGCLSETRAGVKTVEKIIGFLEDDKEHVRKIVDQIL